MKILYGVQGTGNGHITRARAMATELAAAGIEVDYLFSGRSREQLFDMETFGDYMHRTGLTFTVYDGRIRPLATLRDSRPGTFIRDVRDLNLAGYDLVLTDYEPISAWAARLRGLRVVGLGHQYAFRYSVPQYRGNAGQRWLMRYFAPATVTLGLHWHHFDQPILPPIAPVDTSAVRRERRLLLVYLPFESPQAITTLLEPFDDHTFLIYHPQANDLLTGHHPAHLHWHLPGRLSFQRDLLRCEGVICNAGFELASETLQLGKKLLVKPVCGQPEQHSNALALDLLGYGQVMNQLDRGMVAGWLDHARGAVISYPNVAAAICTWLAAGATASVADLAADLWARTVLPDIHPATGLRAAGHQ